MGTVFADLQIEQVHDQICAGLPGAPPSPRHAHVAFTWHHVAGRQHGWSQSLLLSFSSFLRAREKRRSVKSENGREAWPWPELWVRMGAWGVDGPQGEGELYCSWGADTRGSGIAGGRAPDVGGAEGHQGARC